MGVGNIPGPLIFGMSPPWGFTLHLWLMLMSMSYINQHTEFLSQDQWQQEDSVMMLASSTKPKRKGEQ